MVPVQCFVSETTFQASMGQLLCARAAPIPLRLQPVRKTSGRYCMRWNLRVEATRTTQSVIFSRNWQQFALVITCGCCAKKESRASSSCSSCGVCSAEASHSSCLCRLKRILHWPLRTSRLLRVSTRICPTLCWCSRGRCFRNSTPLSRLKPRLWRARHHLVRRARQHLEAAARVLCFLRLRCCLTVMLLRNSVQNSMIRTRN